MELFLALLPWVVAIVLIVGGLVATYVLITLRRVVETNMVHIVQSSKQSISYGKGLNAGNTYYAFPSWVPKLGITITKFPLSIFQVSLQNYEAYDKERLPFVVDVAAFFRIERSEDAAQRVANFQELEHQLDSVLKGAVRRILATNTLEHILEARATLSMEFTTEVNAQIAEWGVTTAKSIEFMDIRDHSSSKVIANIMAKDQSRIDMESRTRVADNKKKAQLAEIDAEREVNVQKQQAEQLVGIRTAEKEKLVGLANEVASQEVLQQTAITTEKEMDVARIKQGRAALIAKEVLITNTEAAREQQVINANAALQKTKIDAEGIVVKSEADLALAKNTATGTLAAGEATAKSQQLLLLAPVNAQITLAKEISASEGYQNYLVRIRQVEASQAVGEKMADALAEADLRVISNGGPGSVMEGATSLMDMFTTKGGTAITGLLTSLVQSPEGEALVAKLTGKEAPEAPPPSSSPTARRGNLRNNDGETR